MTALAKAEGKRKSLERKVHGRKWLACAWFLTVCHCGLLGQVSFAVCSKSWRVVK